MELGAERLSYLTLHNQFQNLRFYLPYKHALPELGKRRTAVKEQQTGGSEVGGAAETRVDREALRNRLPATQRMAAHFSPLLTLSLIYYLVCPQTTTNAQLWCVTCVSYITKFGDTIIYLVIYHEKSNKKVLWKVQKY